MRGIVANYDREALRFMLMTKEVIAILMTKMLRRRAGRCSQPTATDYDIAAIFGSRLLPLYHCGLLSNLSPLTVARALSLLCRGDCSLMPLVPEEMLRARREHGEMLTATGEFASFRDIASY